MILSTEEIIKEARKLHPDVADTVVDEVDKFLTSTSNDEELNGASVKQITEKFLKALIKVQNNNEN